LFQRSHGLLDAPLEAGMTAERGSVTSEIAASPSNFLQNRRKTGAAFDLVSVLSFS